jgi:hypothetical protein
MMLSLLLLFAGSADLGAGRKSRFDLSGRTRPAGSETSIEKMLRVIGKRDAPAGDEGAAAAPAVPVSTVVGVSVGAVLLVLVVVAVIVVVRRRRAQAALNDGWSQE